VRRRILTTIIAVTTAAVLGLFVPASIAIAGAIRRGDLLDVQRDASIAASLVPAEGPVDVATLQRALGPDRRVGLYSRDGALVGGFGPDRPDPIVSRAIAGSVAEGHVGDALVAAVPVRMAGGGPALAVRIAEPRANSRTRMARSITLLAAEAVLILAVAVLFGLLLARRLNRPIDELRSWTGTDRPDPPDATGIREIDALRAVLVDERSRVEDLLARERSFSSQVSHQLRTPVAALRVALETELEAPRRDHTDVLHESLGALDRLEATIGSLLSLSRHARQPAVSIDPSALATERVRWWRPRFEQSGRTVDSSGPPVPALAVEAAVEHILDVLLENALAHGRGAVRVETTVGSGAIHVDIADRGPRPDPDPLVDEDRERRCGIGLHMARSLAESFGGRLVLLDRPSTTFRLVLRAAPRPGSVPALSLDSSSLISR